jgi:hypothetical protein
MGDSPADASEVTLFDLLDRSVQRGVVIAGDIRISVADIDLIYVGLRLVVTSISGLERAERAHGGPSGRPTRDAKR